MTREEIIERFCQMGNWIEQGLESGEFDAVIRSAFAKNTWFCEEFVKQALKGIALWLRKDEMESFVADYGFAKEPKKVAIIAATAVVIKRFIVFSVTDYIVRIWLQPPSLCGSALCRGFRDCRGMCG